MSSVTDNVRGPAGAASLDALETYSKPTYKSYKKKYRKMKHTFEEKMRESNSLFREEQRATDIARRLQENNDQLLDLLLDINDSCRIPPPLHFDLRSPSLEASDIPLPEPNDHSLGAEDSFAASAAFEEAKADLASGELSPGSYSRVVAALANKVKPTSLSSLQAIPHTTLASVAAGAFPDDISSDSPPGYLTPTHEDDYLFAVDGYLGSSTIIPRVNTSTNPVRLGEKGSEKEAQVRNPVSVYNWLRKHQPQVFLQDNEMISDKSSVKLAHLSKAAKRPSIVTKPDHEIIDEDGFLISETMGSTKGKRKRDDEPYRPKGGSSRPAKRKRDDGGNGAKKVRKLASAGNGS
ncbi:MAG: hypothetical protein M1830_000121 [Pleopsidium flavum]|nr:MAG: hypothetical protein M1830_000121 [Pleopsidium flavum]